MPGISRRAAIKVSAATAAGTYVAPKILWSGKVMAQQLSGPPIDLELSVKFIASDADTNVHSKQISAQALDQSIAMEGGQTYNSGISSETVFRDAHFHGDATSLIERLTNDIRTLLTQLQQVKPSEIFHFFIERIFG